MDVRPMQHHVHIAMFPSPGMGHIIPLTKLARLFILRHNFFITFIIPNDDASTSHTLAQKTILQSLPKTNTNSIFLPPVTLADLPKNTMIQSRISLCVNRSLPSLRVALTTLKQEGQHISAFFVNILGVFAIDIAKEYDILSYVLFFSSAMALSLVLNSPHLDETVHCEYRDMTDPVRLPGCIPLNGKDLPDHFQDKTCEAYKFGMEKCKMYQSAEGIVINTFWELEPRTLEALKGYHVPVYPVGPLIQTANSSTSSDNIAPKTEVIMKWLDEQPVASVMYVAFGSGGTLSRKQIIELSFGLEMSDQKFVWIVKTPNEESNAADFFSSSFEANTSCETLWFLPCGFQERVKERGVVISSWVPQTLLLSHRAIGGFVTHCGWNSCLEGFVNGVPFIAWPLFAEQRMIAALLTDGLEVALRVKLNVHGLVERHQITTLVKELLEGEKGKEIKNRMREVKEASANTWNKFGSSDMALQELVEKWI